jgi:hypothetical protein
MRGNIFPDPRKLPSFGLQARARKVSTSPEVTEIRRTSIFPRPYNSFKCARGKLPSVAWPSSSGRAASFHRLRGKLQVGARQDSMGCVANVKWECDKLPSGARQTSSVREASFYRASDKLYVGARQASIGCATNVKLARGTLPSGARQNAKLAHGKLLSVARQTSSGREASFHWAHGKL